MANRYTHIWTEQSVLDVIRAFVLAEHRYPSVHDFEHQAHGLPSNSGTAYRHCPHFKALLAKEGIVCTETPRSTQGHPWKRDRWSRR